MIDTNELRRLAQAATPGPWGNTDPDPTIINSPYNQLAICYRNSRALTDAKFIAAANPAAISELLDRLEGWEKVFGHLGMPDEVGNEWHALSKRLEEAEKALEVERMRLAACGVAALGYFAGCAKEYQSASLDDVITLRKQLEAAEKERDALRATVERMDAALESLLIRCDDSDSGMYGTLSTSFVRDTVRIARDALEETK